MKRSLLFSIILLLSGCGGHGGSNSNPNPNGLPVGGTPLFGNYIEETAKHDFDNAASDALFCSDVAKHPIAHGVDFAKHVSLQQPYVIYGDVIKIMRNGQVFRLTGALEDADAKSPIGNIDIGGKFSLSPSFARQFPIKQDRTNSLASGSLVQSSEDKKFLVYYNDETWRPEKNYVSISKSDAEAYFKLLNRCGQVGLFQAKYTGIDSSRRSR